MIKTVSVLEATAALILLDSRFAPSVASGCLLRLVPSLVTGTQGALEIVPALCCDSEALARACLSSKEPWFLVGVASRDHIPGAGAPTALGWSSSLGLPWGFPGNRPCVGRLKVPWSHAGPPHSTAGRRAFTEHLAHSAAISPRCGARHSVAC